MHTNLSSSFTQLIDVSAEELPPMLNRADLNTLVQLAHHKPSVTEIIMAEYRSRFNSIVGPFVPELASFKLMMCSTCSFISGSLPLYFWFPDMSCSGSKRGLRNCTDMDLYCRKTHTSLVLNHLCKVQGFSVLPFSTDIRSNSNNYYYNSSDKTGISKVYCPERGKQFVDVIVSANNCSYYPILFFISHAS